MTTPSSRLTMPASHSTMPVSRRSMLAGTAAAAGLGLMPHTASAKGGVIAAIYPGTWDEAYRSIVMPALKKAHNVDLEMQPLFAVDQIAKARASRGAPPFDVFVLDPGPRITGIDGGLFEKFDPKKLTNTGNIPGGIADDWGVGVTAQVVGIVYNPKKLPKPKGWTDLFKDPWASRLALTGFQTTFGTVSLIEMAKAFGGSEANMDPVFAELKKILPKVAAVSAPAALPSIFQQGQADIMYTNTQTVSTLKGRGIDVEFVVPETGAITFYSTMHIAKGSKDQENAYKYIDTVLAKDVQAALMLPPNNFVPVNKGVALAADLPMKTLDEMAKFIRHDWAKINPQRAAWIERFNKEMAK